MRLSLHLNPYPIIRSIRIRDDVSSSALTANNPRFVEHIWFVLEEISYGVSTFCGFPSPYDSISGLVLRELQS